MTQRARLGQQAGFTMVEIIVVIAVFAITLISMSSFFSYIQGAQRNVQYLDIATAAAKDEIELLRNTNYSLLAADQTIYFTSSLPDTLPANKVGTAVIGSSGMTGIRRVDVTVTYSVGSYPHTVKMSALIGESGLTQ